jgi:diaminopimelate epimerase
MRNDLRAVAYDAAGNRVLIIDARRSNLCVWPLCDSVRHRVSCAGSTVDADIYVFIIASSPECPRVRFFNPDWTYERLCGNGLRSVAAYLLGQRAKRTEQMVETDEGRLRVFLNRGGKAGTCIPLDVIQLKRIGADPLVRVGTPHRIRVVEDLSSDHVARLGKQWSCGSRPVNATFVKLEEKEISLRTFERGVGETRSCGTGAIAAAFAIAPKPVSDYSGEKIIRYVSGEKLLVRFRPASRAVELSGPVKKLCQLKLY